MKNLRMWGVLGVFLVTGAFLAEAKENNEFQKKSRILSVLDSDTTTISNGTVTIILNDYGQFTMQRASDDKWLLYPKPETGFLSVNIDGDVYTNCKGGTFTLMDTSSLVKVDATTAYMKYTTPKNVDIIQTFTLKGEAVEFKVEAINKDSISHNVKIRYLFDTQLDVNDGAPLYASGVVDPVTGANIVIHETNITTIGFDSWGAQDKYDEEPTVVSKGYLTTKPYRMVFAWWPSAVDHDWDYTSVGTRSFYTPGYVKTPESDSCCLVYMDIGNLAPSESGYVSTYYGIGEPAIIDEREQVKKELEKFRDEIVNVMEFDANLMADVLAKTYIKTKVDGGMLMVNILSGFLSGNVISEWVKSLSENVKIMHTLYKGLELGVTIANVYGWWEEVNNDPQLKATPEHQLPTYFLSKMKSSMKFEDVTGLAAYEKKIKDIINSYINSLPDPLPENYPVEKVIEWLKSQREAISDSTKRETWVMVEDVSEDVCRIVPLGSLVNQHKHIVNVYEEYEKISDFHNALTWTEIALIAGTGFVKLVCVVFAIAEPTPTGEIVILNPGVETVLWSPLAAVSRVESGASIYEMPKRGHLILKTSEMLCSFNKEIETLGYLSRETIDDLENMFVAPAVYNVEILSVDIPNVMLEEEEIGGKVTGTITVKNHSPNSVSVIPQISVYPNSFGIASIFPIALATSERYNLVPNETKALNFSTFIMRNSLAGCDGYTADVYVRTGPIRKVGPYQKTFYVDTEYICDIYTQQNISNILSGGIETGSFQGATYQSSAEEVASGFILSYPGSDLDLHIYDSQNNHVGVNYTTGEVEIQIPNASYSGPATNPESVYLPQSTSQNYIVKVVAVDTSGTESFSVTAIGIPRYPAIIQASPVVIAEETSPNKIFTKQIILREIGQQHGVSNLQFSASDLLNSSGHIISSSNISFNLQGTTTISTGSSTVVEVNINIPLNTPGGIYKGTISVSGIDASSGDSISTNIPLSINNFVVASDLLNVRIYPNPYKPYDGNRDTGIPYDGSTNSGIIFDNLTQDCTIKIFNIAGELVRELSGTGKIQWDAKNSSGKEVASGIYIYLVTDKAGNKPAKGKLAILR